MSNLARFTMHKILFLALNILFSTNLNAQSNFELKEVKTDYVYTNFIQTNGKLYVGSNNGALEIDEKNNIKQINTSLKGYLSIINEKIVGNKLTEDNNYNDNKYNYLLPDQFKKSQSRITLYNNSLYIINNNVLFRFYKNPYTKSHDSLSVRSITKNLIGSYSGIYNKGIKLNFPLFTDGNIKEYNNEYFICYGGLYRDSSGNIFNYYNQKLGEVQIGNTTIGSARDILKLKNGDYVLTTNLGIYIINFINKTAYPVIETKVKNEYFLTFNMNTITEDLNSFYYIEEGKVINYNNANKEKTIILNTKQKSIIKDVYVVNSSNFYILFDDKVIKYTKNYTTNKFEETTLVENLAFCHNIKLYNYILCITTNSATHFYDTKTNKSYLNAIPYEANRRSLCIINDTIKFATTNGIFNLSENDLSNLLNDIDNTPIQSYKIDSNTKTYIIIILIITIIAIITFGLFYIKSRKFIVENKNIIPLTNKELIEKYIQENITKVTIHGICEKFKINPNQLYDILENEKPGELIRNHRIQLVRKYRREKKDEKFISENTGFSESYLKKIV